MTLAYKTAKTKDGKSVVITLEVPEDALTNFHRGSAIVKETAKYRVSKAKVLVIEDEKGKKYSECVSSIYNKKSLIYKVSEVVKVDDYYKDPNTICAPGIHVFLKKRVAELYNKETIEDGVYDSWYPNGRRKSRTTYKDGKIDGLLEQWYENGEKAIEHNYKNGELDGLMQEWYEDGTKMREWIMENGVPKGRCHYWYPNGMKV